MDLQKYFSALRDAMLNAFPHYELKEFALFHFHKDLNQDFSGPPRQQALEFIQWADGEGLCDVLFTEALKKKPNNSRLLALSEQLRIDVRAELDQIARTLSPYRSQEEFNPNVAAINAVAIQQPIRKLVSENLVTGHLQAFAVKAPFLRTGQAISEWILTLQQRFNSVCSIAKNGQHFGTGFLIGNDLVMTNCHVTDLVGSSRAEICFGFLDGVNRANLPIYSVTAELARSPPKECDYSILKLASVPSGNLTPIPATLRALTLREPVFVIGHPNELPLRLSSGVVWDENSFVGRAAYSANTQPGSSGSPVFDEGWRLIGLHHQGEENMNNHGISMRAILADLQGKNLHHLLTIKP